MEELELECRLGNIPAGYRYWRLSPGLKDIQGYWEDVRNEIAGSSLCNACDDALVASLYQSLLVNNDGERYRSIPLISAIRYRMDFSIHTGNEELTEWRDLIEILLDRRWYAAADAIVSLNLLTCILFSQFIVDPPRLAGWMMCHAGKWKNTIKVLAHPILKERLDNPHARQWFREFSMFGVEIAPDFDPDDLEKICQFEYWQVWESLQLQTRAHLINLQRLVYELYRPHASNAVPLDIVIQMTSALEVELQSVLDQAVELRIIKQHRGNEIAFNKLIDRKASFGNKITLMQELADVAFPRGGNDVFRPGREMIEKWLTLSDRNAIAHGGKQVTKSEATRLLTAFHQQPMFQAILDMGARVEEIARSRL